VNYRVAATAVAVVRARQVPAGEVHAFLRGRLVTVCGRQIGDGMVTFAAIRWSARPAKLPVCRICFASAR
jgi:hypothetical protein